MEFTGCTAFPWRRICLIVFACSVMSGCGKASGDLIGTVYLDEKPITSGFVTVVGADGSVQRSEIQETGSYAVKGIPAGEVTVLISSPPFDDGMVGRKLHPSVKKDSG